jgi:hydrogenase nickel incorporation protein HypA/HybF
MPRPVHELAISRSVLTMVADVARKHGGAVRKVVLRIGPLSGVEPASLLRAYPIAAAATVAEGSELVIEATDVVVRCRVCEATSHTTANDLVCGACGNWQTDLVSGDEMLLVRVELTPQEAEANV